MSKTDDSLGQSEAFLAFQEKLSRVAKVDRPVLLIGERGTGKELAASRLHYLSQRWQEPLVTLNCAALTPSLITSELFGHVAGAFTGAERARPGRFEVADKGTLFLDEIGSIPLEAQEKLLRVVEYGSFEMVGSNKSKHVDVRIVGATHKDLVSLAKKNLFKRDLLDRLSFEVLFLPPLRARQEDISLLANHFAMRMAVELGRETIPRLSDKALSTLYAYRWPGNIRELKNVIERAVYQAQDDIVEQVVFDPFSQQDEFLEAPVPPMDQDVPTDSVVNEEFLHLPMREAISQLECKMIASALSKASHNQTSAAKMLGLTYNQFRGLYRKYKTQLEGKSSS